MSKAIYLKYLQESGHCVSPFAVLKHIGDFDNLALSLPENKHYAIRSSANLEDSFKYSFAGIFDSYLNIPRKSLLEYIPKVFDFSKNDRLRTYLDYFRLNAALLQMEVIIQEMVNCEKAGVAFSQNPANGMPETYIEAVWGLGEQCVSGKSICDKIRADGDKIISYDVGFQNKMSVCDMQGGIALQNVELMKQSKRKLSEKEISSIAKTMGRLSADISFGFEIEWGFADGCLYLFQLRPITTAN